MAELGLRERKKQQTRQLILDTAARLFTERGFDGVSVAEIARATQLSEVTVFNYFPAKEDLVFGRMEFFEERLVAAVEQRAAGESAVAAFGRAVIAGADQLVARVDMIAKAATLIRSSPALQAREREVTERYTKRLTEVLAAGTGGGGDDMEARVVAGALMAVHRGLLEYVRDAVLAGRRGKRLAQDATAQAGRALARLESGLADYPANRQAGTAAD
ncbi:TetR/AcrR family transcriptional regulator [Hamadaea tsunoensis]|uniref:TetR/AcrR family transcriptional regulator n=1 Tax=Hamadaea tsunoensis TaxID=53368 RepID=UPI00041ED6B7|nr:TetR family transcriptional regulator [Hamadaea tsunoensis]